VIKVNGCQKNSVVGGTTTATNAIEVSVENKDIKLIMLSRVVPVMSNFG